jgi:hypothetical protein
VIRKFARLLLGCLLIFPVPAQRGGAMRGGFGSVRVDSVAARVMEGSSDQALRDWDASADPVSFHNGASFLITA